MCVFRQGAIDLVQMRQQAIDADLVQRELNRYRRFYHPPKLIQSSPRNGGETKLLLLACSWTETSRSSDTSYEAKTVPVA